MLIITDENTTGLDGEVQTPDDIDRLLSAGEIDKISNHSAFFADNITTKENRDSSGSRGQGKKGALYHGRFDVNDQQRILMILILILEMKIIKIPTERHSCTLHLKESCWAIFR